MAYIRTDDPTADFERYSAEQEKQLDKLPVCNYCEEPIQDDFYYYINGDSICETCLDRFFRKDVSEYVG